ncbi:hypothetical protein V2A60_007282 [Cordyceps javanica]
MSRNVMFLLGALATVAIAQMPADAYDVPAVPNVVGQPLDGFVSYSIEFASFPEFAGNMSSPNRFSYNLLKNLGDVMGTNPYIRVGGNTQDYALFNSSQPEALIGIVDPNRSPDYPTSITIGPAYFESYNTWPGFKYSHGLNLGLGGNRSAGWQTLVETVPLVCKTLANGKLYIWEYGNEPDLYGVSAQGSVRPPSWDEASFVWQWLNGTKEIRSQVKKNCPSLAEPRYMAPSFAALSSPLKEPKTWQSGLNTNQDIELYSTHNYISGATSPGVTLQGTLMNFGVTQASVNNHVQAYNSIFKARDKASAPPLIFGETNSLYNQGRPGLSNTFGAALWGVNFNLFSASVGFKRVHMHQGVNYRYQAWQPVDTDKATKGTKAPYYGSMAVAAMLRNSASQPVSVSNIALGNDQHEAAYHIARTIKMSTDKITFLTNWHATPYHAPLYLAQSKGFFASEGIKVALLEPNDPSDVTEIIGSGSVNMGFKAMIHTLAAKARNFPVTSIGSLLDEPFTGVVYLKDSGITTDFRSLKGKRIGYVGEFGKIQIDELTSHYGLTPEDYTAVRCGMNVSKAIKNGEIDAGIGLENVQMVELEEWLESQGRPKSDVQMLRIDELAELGCCCFCSILYIANDQFLAENPDKVRAFLRAVKRATDFVLDEPEQAWAEYVDFKPVMGTRLNRKIFERSYAYFSRDLQNVKRDWTKVTKYGQRLGVLGADFVPNYTNEHLEWVLDEASEDPTGDQKRMVELQCEVACNGGFRRLPRATAA